MLIDREHYLQLLNRAQFLEHQNQVLVRENQILSHELQNQKCANYELMEKLTSLQEHTSSLNSQVMQQNQAIHSDIKGQMIQLSMKQKKYLEEQFQNLEHSSFQKYKLLEIKNTAKRIENHELSEFCEKIKKIYKKYNEQKEPSLNDVVKWIKTTTTKKNKSENRCQDTEKKHLEATKTSQLYKPK